MLNEKCIDSKTLTTLSTIRVTDIMDRAVKYSELFNILTIYNITDEQLRNTIANEYEPLCIIDNVYFYNIELLVAEMQYSQFRAVESICLNDLKTHSDIITSVSSKLTEDYTFEYRKSIPSAIDNLRINDLIDTEGEKDNLLYLHHLSGWDFMFDSMLTDYIQINEISVEVIKMIIFHMVKPVKSYKNVHFYSKDDIDKVFSWDGDIYSDSGKYLKTLYDIFVELTHVYELKGE